MVRGSEKMDKKSKREFIIFFLAVFVMAIWSFGAAQPGSIGDFSRYFGKAFSVLIVIPLLVVFWWEIDIDISKISKKRFYVWCALVACGAALAIWSMYSLKRERPMIDKAYSLAIPLWVLGVALIHIIKYTKAQRSKQSENND